jgi:riboflavin kinase/FMN adenylyltransferase
MELLRLGSKAAAVGSHSAVAVGNFDGVHRGHQALVAGAVAAAHEAGGSAVVLTFDPHPARVLRPQAAPSVLTTLAQKEERVAELGVERLVVLGFDAAVAELSPDRFARAVLREALGARHVVVGESFRFGRGRAGDAGTLAALGEAMDFDVRVVPPVLHAGRPVSSSRVREALVAGDVVEAAALLGRPYELAERVVRGEGRGRTLGIPTLNLARLEQLLPARGVYAGRCRTADGAWRLAVINVGERPTFGGRGLTVEAHLVDFAGELYDTRVRLAFHARLRGEQRFASAAELVACIREDVRTARALLPPPGAAGV